MSLLSNLNDEIKTAMKSKDNLKLESLRAIKAAVLLHQTGKGGGNNPSYEEEIKILHRLVKQRKESANIYLSQKPNFTSFTETCFGKYKAWQLGSKKPF